MEPDELDAAWDYWSWRYPHRETDLEIEPLLKLEVTSGWLIKAREALQLSRAEVARRLLVNRAAYRKMELAEEKMSIETLRKYAAAMDCEVVYAIRPRRRIPFARVIGDVVFERAVRHERFHHVRHPGRAWALAAMMQYWLEHAGFRRQRGWARRGR